MLCLRCPKCGAFNYEGFMNFPNCHRCHEPLRQCAYCVHFQGRCSYPEKKRFPLVEEEGVRWCAAYESILAEPGPQGRGLQRPLASRSWMLVMFLLLTGLLLAGVAQFFPLPPPEASLQLILQASRRVKVGDNVLLLFHLKNGDSQQATSAVLRIQRDFFRHFRLERTVFPPPAWMQDEGRFRYLYYPNIPPGGRRTVQLWGRAVQRGEFELVVDLWPAEEGPEGWRPVLVDSDLTQERRRIVVLPRSEP